MLIINVEALLEAKRKADKAKKPKPKIKVEGSQVLVRQVKPKVEKIPETVDGYDRDGLLKQLWNEMAQLKRQRGKLSSQWPQLVRSMHEQLRRESPPVAEEFMKGNLPVPELAEHYHQVQEITEKTGDLYDKIRHVEQYGKLPAEKTRRMELRVKQADKDTSAIICEIRRLNDLIHKTNKSINQVLSGLRHTKSIEKMAEWKEKLALAEARRTDLKQQLKLIQYGARGKRDSVPV